MEEAKYGVGQTVFARGKLGIIEKIVTKETTIVTRRGEAHKNSKEYGVRSNWHEIFPYKESDLSLSKQQLHKDAFKVQEGQVILKNGREYLVIETTERAGFGWSIVASELVNGQYNPENKILKFSQNLSHPVPLEIVREMKLPEKKYK